MLTTSIEWAEIESKIQKEEYRPMESKKDLSQIEFNCTNNKLNKSLKRKSI